DASIVLALALMATRLLRRRSAALRHAILAAAIVCALLMPAFEWLLPSVPVIAWDRGATVQSSGVTLVSDITSGGAETATDAAPAGTGVSWMFVLGVAWVLGSVVALAGLLVGFLRLARLRRRCTPVTGHRRAETDALARECGVPRHVALFQSNDRTQPVTYGVLAPGIILPADATHWSDDRWHIVLRHELAHIARYDAALQITSELLRILQPFNPLVWIACRRLRQESEYACDDEVLGGGVPPTDYAAHLLDVAKHLSGRHVAMAAAPAIAHPSTLERRIVAMLQSTKDRTPLTGRGRYAAIVAALSLSLPLAAAGIAPVVAVVPVPPTPAAVPAPVPKPAPVRPPAAPPQAGSIEGQVVDQTGGVIPGVTVTLIDQQTSQSTTTTTAATGRFVFRDLPAGEYTLTGAIPGFTTIAASFSLAPGAALTPRFTIAVGTLRETITVMCGPEEFSLIRALFPVLEARQTTVTPIRVGGQVREPKKIRDVRPTCPAGVVTSEVRVALTGRIDIEGAMIDVALDDREPGLAPPPELVNAAIEAVRQWRFTPTELNRQPIEVGVRVYITFKPAPLQPRG
ncbi:MAG: M56 family metallopeptidase, partial [Acidobacteria bacterium]|nr:M56 family metallopeptidase [Acidobacteriota bacterium]